MSTANLKSLTPVLIVEAVEPCAQFWIDKLGFTKPTEVPGDDGKLVFVILQKDGVEIMIASILACAGAGATLRDDPRVGASSLALG